MQGKRPEVLILTATITPPSNVTKLVRKEPQIRLADYCETLRFYLGVSSRFIDRIIFIENSDSDLRPIKELVETVKHDKNVEIISFHNGNDYPPEFGKGYGEFRMINYGLSQSKILSDTDVLWKVTGRLRVLNIERLIEKAPQNYMIYSDFRNVPLVGNYLGGNEWMELRLFSFTLEGYNKYFRDRADSLRESIINETPEQYLYKILKEVLPTGTIIPRFTIQPILAGYSGWSNTDYQDWKYTFKNRIRFVARHVAPWLWL